MVSSSCTAAQSPTRFAIDISCASEELLTWNAEGVHQDLASGRRRLRYYGRHRLCGQADPHPGKQHSGRRFMIYHHGRAAQGDTALADPIKIMSTYQGSIRWRSDFIIGNVVGYLEYCWAARRGMVGCIFLFKGPGKTCTLWAESRTPKV